MMALLDNPLIQSALLPFIVALVLAVAIGAVAPQWRGLAVPLSFYPAALLIAGTQLLPLTSTRKILLLGVMAVIAAALFFWRQFAGRRRYLLLIVFITTAVCWLLWPLLLRAEGLGWLPVLAASLAYMLWSVLLLDSQRSQAAIQLLSVIIFSAAVSIAATIGATALLGQLAGALAAATGALLLVMLMSGKTTADDMLLLPVILMASLFGLAAVVYASLSWSSLLCLMAIALVSRLPLRINNIWTKLLVQLLLMLIMATGAVYLAWEPGLDQGRDSYY